MSDPAPPADPENRRAPQLDALAATQPMDPRDQLTKIPSEDAVATLKPLATEGTGENSLSALVCEQVYREVWVLAAIGRTPIVDPTTSNHDEFYDENGLPR